MTSREAAAESQAPRCARRLADTLADLRALGFDVALNDDPGAGWIPLGHYSRDPDVLDAALALAGSRFGDPAASAMSAGWLVGDVAAVAAWPAAAAMIAHDSLLVTDASAVFLPHPSSGRRLTARFATTTVRNRADSAAAFATGITAALENLVERVHRRTNRSRHALWGTVTDMVVAAFDRTGDVLHRRHDARRFGEAVLARSARLAGGANWHDVTWPGGVEHTLIRNICCLWYRTEGGQLCLTCPRATEDDRKQILMATAAQKAMDEAPSRQPR